MRGREKKQSEQISNSVNNNQNLNLCSGTVMTSLCCSLVPRLLRGPSVAQRSHAVFVCEQRRLAAIEGGPAAPRAWYRSAQSPCRHRPERRTAEERQKNGSARHRFFA